MTDIDEQPESNCLLGLMLKQTEVMRLLIFDYANNLTQHAMITDPLAVLRFATEWIEQDLVRIESGVNYNTIPFAKFWEYYPRKTNRAKAEAVWTKLKPDQALFAKIIQNISRRIACGEWTPGQQEFIPHATTYLAGRRWEDDVIVRERSTRSRDLSSDYQDKSWATRGGNHA